jgi:hypothetical protein
MQEKHSRGTGLIPDFIQSPLDNPRPARAHFLEGKSDGQVGYNACRVPWRLASDFAVSGDRRAKEALEKMVRAAQGNPVGGKPGKVMAGYTLAGRPTANWSDVVFTAPLGTAAIIGASHQAMLDSFWAGVVRSGSDGYFGDSVRLLSLILMTGNWWSPWSQKDPCAGIRG